MTSLRTLKWIKLNKNLIGCWYIQSKKELRRDWSRWSPPPRLAHWDCDQSGWRTEGRLKGLLDTELLIGWRGGRRPLEDGAGGGILGHEDLVLDTVDEEAVGLSAVGVVGLSQWHQLHRLALRGTAGGARHKHRAKVSHCYAKVSCYFVQVLGFYHHVIEWKFSGFFFVELSQYFVKVLLFSVTIFTFLNETIAISLEGLTALVWNYHNFSRTFHVFKQQFSRFFYNKLSRYFVKVFCDRFHDNKSKLN